jgi:peptide/nickel transport system permease protein
MLRFLIMRSLFAMTALLGITAVVFVLGRISGDPVSLLLGEMATPDQRAELATRLGLDRPILSQYWTYLQGLARGDFGVSLRYGRPVIELIGTPFANSIVLATTALVLAVSISIPLGVTAAVHRGRPVDRAIGWFVAAGQALPAFWLGMVAILIFAVHLRWLPAGGLGGWRELVLPALTLALLPCAGIVRLLRSGMLEVLDQEYIKLARTKGLSEGKVIWKHALRNALIPAITFIGFIYALSITSALSVEVVFSWPGLGRLAYEAVLWRDFPLLQFAVFCFSAIIITVSFAVDVLYVLLNPRVEL